jgi:L-fuculose-phosphate aldolase
MSTSFETIAGDLVDACRVLARHGHEDKNLGHLSWRDSDGRGFWLKRSGIGLGEVRHATDFVLVGFDGEVLAGAGARHIEWPIHAGVLNARPDAQLVFHSHPHHAVVFSALDEPLQVVGNEGTLFVDGVPRFTRTADLIRDLDLGAAVADTLGAGRALLLRNHGIVVAAATVADLVMTAIYLEMTARFQLELFATGRPFAAVEGTDARAKHSRVCSSEVFESFWAYERRMLTSDS